MKKVPMILLLLAPAFVVAVCYVSNIDLTIGLYIYGGIIVLNLIYACFMPRLGFDGKNILVWNLILKLGNIPMTLLIFLVVLVMMMMIGGKANKDLIPALLKSAFWICYLIQLPSVIFGLSGFLWCRKRELLSVKGVIAGTITQLIPIIGLFSSIYCYVLLCRRVENN